MQRRTLKLAHCISIILMLFLFAPSVNIFITTTDNEDTDVLSCSTQLRTPTPLTKRSLEDDTQKFPWLAMIPEHDAIYFKAQVTELKNNEQYLFIPDHLWILTIRGPPPSFA